MAIKLSGSNAATLAQGYLSNTGGPWTIMFWVKQVSIATTNDYQVCIYKDTNNQLAPIFGFIANKYEFFTVGGSGGNLRTSSDIAPGDTNWHHIAYRKTSGTAAWDKFLDGVKTSINASIAYTTPTGMTNVTLGGDVTGGNLSDSSFFRLFILAQLISDGNIALEAAAGYPSITFGSGDGFWLLNADGSDSSGNAHNFTLPNDITVVSNPPGFLLLTPSETINNLVDSFSATSNIIKTFSDNVNNLSDIISKTISVALGISDSQAANWGDHVATFFFANLHVTDAINSLADTIRIYVGLRQVLGDNFVISDSVMMKFNQLMKLAELLPSKLDSVVLNRQSQPAFNDSVNNLNDSVSIALTVNLRLSKGDTVNLLSDSVSLLLSTSYNLSDIQRIRRYLGDTQSS